jgi:hypothetical protein
MESRVTLNVVVGRKSKVVMPAETGSTIMPPRRTDAAMALRDGCGVAARALALLVFAGAFAFVSDTPAVAGESRAEAPIHPGFKVLTGFPALQARYGNTIVRDNGSELEYRYDGFQNGMAVIGSQEYVDHQSGAPYLLTPGRRSPANVYLNDAAPRPPEDGAPPSEFPTAASVEADPRLRVEINPNIDVTHAKTGAPIGFVGNWILVKGNATWIADGYKGSPFVDNVIQDALRSWSDLAKVSNTLEATFGDMYVAIARGDERRVFEGSTLVVLSDASVTYIEPSGARQGRLFQIENPYPHVIGWDVFSRGFLGDEPYFRERMKQYGIDCAQIPFCDKNAKADTVVWLNHWKDDQGTIDCDDDPEAKSAVFRHCLPPEIRIRKDYASRPTGSLISPPWYFVLVFKGNIFGL